VRRPPTTLPGSGQAEGGPYEEGTAFDGEIGFASGETAAVDGLVVFENIKEAGLQKRRNNFCTADFLEPPCNFLGHRTIQYSRKV
jgi:hypothetical protein